MKDINRVAIQIAFSQLSCSVYDSDADKYDKYEVERINGRFVIFKNDERHVDFKKPEDTISYMQRIAPLSEWN